MLDYLVSGMTTEQIVADFPELSERHVRAAIEFAALRERRLASQREAPFDENLSRHLIGTLSPGVSG